MYRVCVSAYSCVGFVVRGDEFRSEIQDLLNIDYQAQSLQIDQVLHAFTRIGGKPSRFGITVMIPLDRPIKTLKELRVAFHVTTNMTSSHDLATFDPSTLFHHEWKHTPLKSGLEELKQTVRFWRKDPLAEIEPQLIQYLGLQ